MSKDNTQELDDLCPICNGSMWQMNADYEEVPCWHDIHDRDIKQAILDWHNKQVKEVLDRIDKGIERCNDGCWVTIDEERNRLKERYQ